MKETPRTALTYLTLLALSACAAFPLGRVMEVIQDREIVIAPHQSLTSKGVSVFHDPMFLPWAGRAALVALAIAIAGVTLSSLLGFWWSRVNSRPGSGAVVRSPFPQILPAVMLLLPIFFFLLRLGQLRPCLWLGLIYLVTAAPFSIWQLKRSYDRISPSVEEAATIDGSNSWQNTYSILLAAMKPALILTFLFSFLVAWNDYLVLGLMLRVTDLWAEYASAFLFVLLVFALCVWFMGRLGSTQSEAS